MASNTSRKLNDVEKEIVDKIPSASLEEIKQLLSEPGVRIDCLDEQGTTPLQHAAFKGRSDLCDLFLQRGADVNSNNHIDGYTALMFAALSGKPALVRKMLCAGAKTDPVNRVNRTAAQMASFVGYHKCVSTINNFISFDEVDYYTKPQGLEKEAKLPKHLVTPLVELLNNSYLHPLKVSYFLEANPSLLENSHKVQKVLDIMCEKSMKSADTNDVMAIKVNYYSFMIRNLAKSYNEKEKSLNSWIKSLVKGRDSDGFAEKPEKLIRQSMKEFIYIESDLFLQFIRTVSPVAIGDYPTALSVLTNCVHGQQFKNDNVSCEACGENESTKKCSACKMVYYCSQRCQKLRYTTHKKFCAQLLKEFEELEKKNKDANDKENFSEEKNGEQQVEVKEDSGKLEEAVEKIEIKSEV
ncbi:repeat and MYND domain-containing 2-like [Octopus vulgaris]|uniref:Repeat and MYND domain-containing 2-like n=1 Tax=Octopus vulgaris TaxID=6645 RepID=A0AA36B5V8_OCTVU|nr:repeat and MYND domain-containing 2-like [Octopus vulgaris]